MMDIQKFEEEYRKYKPTVYRITFSYMKEKEESEDILQEVFMKLLTLAPDFESEEHEKRWIIRVTVNQCKNSLKSFWRNHRCSPKDITQLPATEEDKEILVEVLALPEKFKIVIYLYYVEGYKCREIGEILEIKESTVKMRLKKQDRRCPYNLHQKIAEENMEGLP